MRFFLSIVATSRLSLLFFLTIFTEVFGAKKAPASQIPLGVGVVTSVKSNRDSVPSATKHHKGNDEGPMAEVEERLSPFPHSSVYYRVSLVNKPQYTYYYVVDGDEVNLTTGFHLTHCRTVKHLNDVEFFRELHNSHHTRDLQQKVTLHFMCGGYYHYCCESPEDNECCDHLQRSLSASKHDWNENSNHSQTYKGTRKSGKIVYITPQNNGNNLISATVPQLIVVSLITLALGQGYRL